MDVRALTRRHGDLALAVALASVYAVEIARWDGVELTWAIPCGVVAGLSLALRRRAPLPVFLVAMAANVAVLVFARDIDRSSIAFIIIYFVALYSLGRHAGGRGTWLGAVAVLGTIIVFLVGDGAHGPGDILFATFFVGTPWAAGVAIRLRGEREQSLTEENRRLELDQEERALRAVAEERARIARELHDVVSHAISVTVLQARGGRRMLGVDDDEVRRSLDAIEHTNTQALGDMRRLLSLLRDPEDGAPTEPQPSLGRLDELIEQVRSSGLAVELEVTGAPGQVPPGVDLSAYRIIQEALTNVLKHAGPDVHATVSVAYGEVDLGISVTDNGTASANGDGHGQGLIGIRERVAVVGGHVDAGPGESGGFVVRARLPYAVQA